MTSIQSYLQLFKERNFRIFFIGQFTSLTGTWTQRVAESWLAYQLTHSAFWLGVVSFTGLFPGILSNLIAGALIDRFDKRKIIIVTQILLLIQASVLCFLTTFGHITITLLIIMSVFQAIISGSDMPARQAFLVELVKKNDLTKAIALNSLMINAGRILGPAIAGIILPLLGIAFAFGFNAVTYLAVVIGLILISTNSSHLIQKKESLFKQISAGSSYVRHHAIIFYFLVLFAVCNFFGMFYTSLLPVLAVEKYHWKSGGFSLLVMASGVGALTGAFLLGVKIKNEILNRALIYSSFGLGAALLGLAFSPNIFIAAGFLILGGLSMMIQIAGTNTLLQIETNDHMRGRVMSFYTFTFTAAAPLGNLFAGALAEKTWVELPLIIGGIILVVISQIYQKKSNLKRLFIPALIVKAKNKVVRLYYNE